MLDHGTFDATSEKGGGWERATGHEKLLGRVCTEREACSPAKDKKGGKRKKKMNGARQKRDEGWERKAEIVERNKNEWRKEGLEGVEASDWGGIIMPKWRLKKIEPNVPRKRA